MLSFHKRYHPLTSRPYLSNHTYTEHQPCEGLLPYIACYWTTDRSIGAGQEKSKVLVIPDTCMDVIIRINHTRQSLTGYLCSIQDEPFLSIEDENGDIVTCFAVRFHFWAAHLFLKLNFNETRNQLLELDEFDKGWRAVFESFFYRKTTKERINLIEEFLLKRIESPDLNANLFNSIRQLLHVPGQMSISDICAYSCVSQRQMERLFLQNIGLPPKRVYRLIRYQCVWNDMVRLSNFDIQDEVHRYGYSDQAHLLKEFKRFHGVTPTEARKIADVNR